MKQPRPRSGKHVAYIAATMTLTTLIANTSQADRLFYSERLADTINKFNIDSFGVFNPIDVISEADRPRDIELDLKNEHIYWAARSGILRSRLDGSELETIANVVSGNRSTGVAVDADAGFLFWSEASAAGIYRANIETGHIEPFITDFQAGGLTIDTEMQRLIWINASDQSLQRGNYDGSQVENVLSIPELEFGKDIALDAETEMIYFTTSSGVHRADYDGGNFDTIHFDEDAEFRGIAVDYASDALFWVDRTQGTVSRSRLDGNDAEELVSDLSAPWGLELDMLHIPVLGDFFGNDQLQTSDIDFLTFNLMFLEGPVEFDSPFDLNQDGFFDNADRIYWVKELAHTYFGDSNLDGEFNSRDLVTVFQAGAFEDELTESFWESGDWNGDGVFTTSDLVRAFQDGGFELGPRMAFPVPEPNSTCLLFLFLAVTMRIVGFHRVRILIR